MESTPLLQNEGRREEKTKIHNLLKFNLIFLVYNLAGNMYNPTFAQYVYKRFSDEVFGIRNGTSNVTSKCSVNKSEPDYILQEKAQQLTSNFQVLTITVASSTAAISCLFLGAYSDFIGRRFLFAVCLLGQGLRNAMNTAVMYWDLDLNFVFIGSVLEGASGGYNGILLAGYAYTADNTPPKNSRILGLAFIDVTANFALTLSQTGTGYIIRYFGYVYPSLASAGLIFLAVILAVVMLPETIHRHGRKYPSPPKAIRNVFGFYFSKEFGAQRYLFWLAVSAYAFAYFSQIGVYYVEYLFQLNQPFCWGPELIGYFNTACAAAKQILSIPVIKLLHLCTQDEGVSIVTAIVQTGAFCLHGVAYTTVMLFSYTIPAAVAVPLLPALRALMSRMSPPELQGSLFAGIVLVDIVSSACGIIAFNELYSQTVEVLRGCVFYIAGGMHVPVAIFAAIYLCMSRRMHTEEKHITVVINDQDQHSGPVNSPSESKEDSEELRRETT